MDKYEVTYRIDGEEATEIVDFQEYKWLLENADIRKVKLITK